MEQKLEIAKKLEEGKLTVTVRGRVDTVTSPQLVEALQDVQGATTLVVDLAGVPYMSSAGLRCLLMSQKAMTKSGGEMIVAGVIPAVREVFDLTGFSDIFTLA